LGVSGDDVPAAGEVADDVRRLGVDERLDVDAVAEFATAVPDVERPIVFPLTTFAAPLIRMPEPSFAEM